MASLYLNGAATTLGWHYVSECNELQDQVSFVDRAGACPICNPREKLELLGEERPLYSKDEWERRVQIQGDGP